MYEFRGAERENRGGCRTRRNQSSTSFGLGQQKFLRGAQRDARQRDWEARDSPQDARPVNARGCQDARQWDVKVVETTSSALALLGRTKVWVG